MRIPPRVRAHIDRMSALAPITPTPDEVTMSYYQRRRLSPAGIDVSKYSIEELPVLVREILDAKLHGVSFSVYTEGQGPGTVVSSDQIRTRLEIISPHVRWIPTFSTTDGPEHA